MEAAEAEALLALLVARAGGRQRVLLVAERRVGDGDGAAPPRALLEGFARDLFGEPGGGGGGGGGAGAAEKGAGGRPCRAVRRAGGCRRWSWCRLAFVLLCGAARGRAARELLREVRGQVSPGAALVAVLVREGEGEGGESAASGEASRLRLEALLRRACARRRPALHEALQAALYSPGSPQGAAPVRAAALRALRAALQLHADGVETEKPRLPTFLRCFPCGRRSQKTAGCLGKPTDASGDDLLQEAEEGVALTNLAPNGNCEEICGAAGTKDQG